MPFNFYGQYKSNRRKIEGDEGENKNLMKLKITAWRACDGLP